MFGCQRRIFSHTGDSRYQVYDWPSSMISTRPCNENTCCLYKAVLVSFSTRKVLLWWGRNDKHGKNSQWSPRGESTARQRGVIKLLYSLTRFVWLRQTSSGSFLGSVSALKLQWLYNGHIRVNSVKQWCDVIFLVMLQGKFEIDHTWQSLISVLYNLYEGSTGVERYFRTNSKRILNNLWLMSMIRRTSVLISPLSTSKQQSNLPSRMNLYEDCSGILKVYHNIYAGSIRKRSMNWNNEEQNNSRAVNDSCSLKYLSWWHFPSTWDT